MTDKILVVIDNPQYATIAVKQAQKVANQTQSQLHVVVFTYEPLEHLPVVITEEQRQQIIEKKLELAQATLDCAVADIPVEQLVDSDVVWHKHPEEWVKENCVESEHSFIVKARHIDKEEQFSPLDWALIRTSPVPVYLAADHKWRKKRAVLATLDLGSKLSGKLRLNKSAIILGQKFAEMNGSEFHAGYTVPVSPFLKDLGIIFPDEAERSALDKIPLKQRTLLEGFDLLDKVHVKAGLPEKVIPSMAADLGAGLVVVGSVGRKGIKGRLVGNTAEKILSLLKTDLLILQPSGD